MSKLIRSLLIPFMALVLINLVPLGNQAEAVVDYYIVQSGDSLWKIAQRYQVGWPEVWEANRTKIADPKLIYPGQRLTIPSVNPEILSTERQVVKLVNQERSKRGLSPLSINWEVQRVARIKSKDMRDQNYFSHQSPTYGSPFQMMRNFGISFRAGGENIAAGQKTPQAVVEGWMNSSGHRANILNHNFTQIGVGYITGGRYGTYWTQLLIRP